MPETLGRATAGALIFLHAHTSLHPGSGTALGVVDLPIQRERHTGWPMVPGSSLKGVLRDAAGRRPEDREDLLAAFGPETSDGDAHAGALSLTDARILAFPVRSLRGVFAWVSCPAVLARFARDGGLAGIAAGFEIPEVPGGKALCKGENLLIGEDQMILEEYQFDRVGDTGAIGSWLAEIAIGDAGTRSRLPKQFVVLSDDDFTNFAQHATEVIARVGLDPKTKTVKKGALFYQEFLPPETLLYSVVLAGRSRRKSCERTAEEILQYLTDLSERTPFLQLGGDETTGKGICAMRIARRGNA